MREPDGEGQGPSAGLEFGPSGHQEGQEREAKAALSPHDAACPGAGLNGSLGSVSGTPGVAAAAGNDLAAGPRARAPSTRTSVRLWPLWLVSFVSAQFSRKDICRKPFSVHWAIVHAVFLYV